MDMNEEKYLNERMSKQNPFRVPEGYFDDFATQVMAKLPERESQPVTAKRVSFRPWMAVAASLVVAIFSVAVYFTQMGGQQKQPQQASATVSDAYMDAAADYAMIDNAEIYAYFVEN